MAYQSLYRRYRPRRFAEVRGQEHVVRALRNAVRDGRVGHAYLFSGPRGTGKTSTARILAKVLNCAATIEGEPCCACDSCRAVEAGTSFDVFELDAASNRGIDDVRDLIERANLGTPGRTKVYILDEVHMLTKEANAALLKTLEEPPAHVVFVLATTDPQKVPETIRSRSQHFEFHLLPAHELEDHVRWVIADAALDVPDEAVDLVLRRGRGSARDTLSALDQVVAGGGLGAEEEPLDEVVEALVHHDTARALAAVAAAVQAGRDPRSLTEHLVAHLRDAFLSLLAPTLVQLPDRTASRVADQAGRLGPAATVRAMEVLGETLVDLRHAPDPRLLLDVALVRLTNDRADVSPSALLTRIERLERALAATPAAPVASATVAEAKGRPEPAPAGPQGVVSTPGPRATLGSRVRSSPSGSVPAAAERPPAEPGAPPATPASSRAAAPAPAKAAAPEGASAPAPAGRPPRRPGRDELTIAWADQVLPRLRGMPKALFAGGRWVDGPDGPVFAVVNHPTKAKCEAERAAVETVLTQVFGGPVPLVLVVEGEAPGAPAPNPAPERAGARSTDRPTPTDEEVVVDPGELVDAPPAASDPIERIARHFPGAELLADHDA